MTTHINSPQEEEFSGPTHSKKIVSSIRIAPFLGGIAILILFFVFFQMLPQGLPEFSYAPWIPAPLPFAPMRGFSYEQLAGHLLRILLATPALILLTLALGKSVQIEAPTEEQLYRFTWFVSVISILIMSVLMFVIFQGRAFVDDEIAYAQHAVILAQGQLGSQDLPYILKEPLVIMGNFGLTTKYLFGEPLVQILGVLLGLPALLHIPFAAISLWAMYQNI